MPDSNRAFRNLPLRLSLPMMASSAFLLLTVITLLLSHWFYQDELIRHAQMRADIQISRLASLARHGDPDEIRREIAMLLARGDISSVVVTDPGHKIRYANRPEWEGKAFSAVLPAGDAMPFPTALQLRWSDDRRELDILKPYEFHAQQDQSGRPDHGLIYIAVNIGSQIDDALLTVFRNHLAILATGVIFALLLYFWVRRSFVRPIEQLVKATRRIGSGYLDTTVDISSSPELSALAGDLNAMTDNLRAIQEVLRIKEEHLRLLGDNLPDSYVYQVKRDPFASTSRFTYLSSGATRIHGIDTAAIMDNAKLLYAQTHPDDVACLIAAEKDSLANLTDFSEVVRIRHADGGLRWLHIHSHPSRHDDGTMVWDGVATDVTSLKQAELDLQNALVASERFREALDHVSVFVYMKDLESRYLYANRHTLELFGCPAHELAGAPMERFYSPETARFLREIDRRVLSGENTAEEIEVVMSDGKKLVFWQVQSPIHITDPSGAREIWGISGISTDITTRRQQERELRQALQVVEASPVVSFRWLAKDGWPVDYVSQNVSRWGYRPEDIRAGHPTYLEIIHPDDQLRVANEVGLHTTAGSTAYMQSYRIRRADGRYFWIEDNTRVIRDDKGELLAYEGVVTDVDVQKRYEQELAKNLAEQKTLNKKLEAAQNQLLQSEKMASIGQLAAGVAHELNNPIGFVNSNLGTLDTYLHDLFTILEAYAEAEAAAGPQCLQLDHVHAVKRDKDYDFLRSDIYQLMAESKDGLARVAKIVRDLKDFSRAGDTTMQWANIHAGLDSTLNIVWNEIKYKCEVTKKYGDLPQVWCEPSQLNQVFMNLLVNAGHAIPDKGEIAITTGCQGDQVFIAIADTGSGIAPEHLNRIFDPFFTTKPVGKGTGLGLSLAYSIVRKHLGRIEVQSEPGNGTTFTVWLPIAPPDNNSAVPPAPTLE